MADIILTQEDADRFWAKTSRNAETGCLEWAARCTSWGYGWFRLGPKARAAHRVAWALVHGTIPAKACVLHRCDNPRCVEPDHLFLGTFADNTRDMLKKGRHAGQRVTHCPRGHAYAGENVMYRANGHRVCRICNRARDLRYPN